MTTTEHHTADNDAPLPTGRCPLPEVRLAVMECRTEPRPAVPSLHATPRHSARLDPS